MIIHDLLVVEPLVLAERHLRVSSFLVVCGRGSAGPHVVVVVFLNLWRTKVHHCQTFYDCAVTVGLRDKTELETTRSRFSFCDCEVAGVRAA